MTARRWSNASPRGLCGLPDIVRSRSGQPCSPSINGRLPRPCDRSAYTYTPSGRSPALLVSFSRVPLGKTPTVTAHGTLGSWANGACVRLSLRGKALLLPRAASTVRSAILRRRNTASSSRLRSVAHHANAASCDRFAARPSASGNLIASRQAHVVAPFPCARSSHMRR